MKRQQSNAEGLVEVFGDKAKSPLMIDTGNGARIRKQNTMASPYDDGLGSDIWSDAGSEPGSPTNQKRNTLKLFTGDEDEDLAP
jgi:hypothetical protein